MDGHSNGMDEWNAAKTGTGSSDARIFPLNSINFHVIHIRNIQ